MFGIKKEKPYEATPLELLDVAKMGGEAATVKRVVGTILQDELDSLLIKLSTSKPDLGDYAHLAGQVFIIYKIKRSLDIRAAEGSEAAKHLQGGTKWP